MTAKKPKTRSAVSFGRETLSHKAIRAGKIDKRLSRAYPDAHCTLNFNNPLELLVATILAAQCTDKRVNLITPKLFKTYPSAKAYAQAKPSTFEKVITSVGFFRNKTKSVLACGRVLLERYSGKVPKTMEELLSLPGVGRKTANVVLGTAFGIPAMVVDTHVSRVAARLGLTDEKDAVKIEFDLVKQIPEEKWVVFSHQVIAHGRSVCKARKPDCPNCPLLKLCPFGKNLMKQA